MKTKYNLPLVLSYPRSGMNWLRHCVERMSGLRTPGPDLGLVDSETYAFCRIHNILRGQHKASPRGSSWEKVCLILRDYRENYVRTPLLQRRRYTTWKAWNYTSYAENIRYFDQFDGPKLLVRYEDHAGGFGETIRFLDWAGIECTALTDDDLAEEVTRSKQCYNSQHKKYYRRTPQREITDEVKRASKASLFNILGDDLFDKYLGCYDDSPQPVRSAA